MAEYIEREALRKLMYEEAFEKDSDMQRWDSGCWIRYKLFENCIEAIPAADVVSRKHYLDALGTINDAHMHPERATEIINAFLERHHSMCMEVDNG